MKYEFLFKIAGRNPKIGFEKQKNDWKKWQNDYIALKHKRDSLVLQTIDCEEQGEDWSVLATSFSGYSVVKAEVNRIEERNNKRLEKGNKKLETRLLEAREQFLENYFIKNPKEKIKVMVKAQSGELYESNARAYEKVGKSTDSLKKNAYNLEKVRYAKEHCILDDFYDRISPTEKNILDEIDNPKKDI